MGRFDEDFGELVESEWHPEKMALIKSKGKAVESWLDVESFTVALWRIAQEEASADELDELHKVILSLGYSEAKLVV